MPRSPRVAPRPPLDRPTLEAALAGDEQARQQLVLAVGEVVRRVLAEWSRHDHDHDPSLGVWRHLTEDGFLVLRQWEPEAGSFEQHVADAVLAWLDVATSKDSSATAWTPALVTIALDEDRRLREQLARDVLAILRRCAYQALHSHGRDGGSATAEDLSQSFAAKLFDKRGAILRQWQPARGRKTLRSYISFIGRRHFNQMMRTGGKLVLAHEDSAELAAPQPEPASLLHRAMMWEAATAELDEGERELLELVRQGLSAEEGAARLGCTANTFNQRKHRLVKKLKEIMGKLDGRDG